MNPYTTDSLFDGCLQVKQYKKGYRFSIDAVLLAHHVRPNSGERILDLGTGCGVIPLILAFRHPDIKIFGVEIQKELSCIAELNIKENGLENRVCILCKDMKSIRQDMTDGPFDMIVSNPPYTKNQSGRINPNIQRAVARHEIKITLADILETACRMLCSMGRMVIVYPALRTTDILTQMRSARIEPKTLRTIHPSQSSEAELVLVEGIKEGGAGMKISRPLVINNDDGSYTKEVEKMFKPQSQIYELGD
jgi:tRNA1Val (adenine37-N6)-methyltransferase